MKAYNYKSATVHVHKRSYLGEDLAKPLVAWLNGRNRKKPDLVEWMTERLTFIDEDPGTKVERLQDVLSMVQRALPSITFRPVLALSFDELAGRNRFTFHWEAVNEAKAEQAAALLALFELASQGLVSRVRQCARPGCNQWLWARFDRTKFHSRKCQEQVYHARPAWKENRAAKMRELRRREKEREQRLQQLHKRKGKGG